MSHYNIKGLSKKALDVMIDVGIIDYIYYRSRNEISKLVFYGENAGFIQEQLVQRNCFNSEIGFDLKDMGVIDGVWHLDIDDLVDLYAKGPLNY